MAEPKDYNWLTPRDLLIREDEQAMDILNDYLNEALTYEEFVESLHQRAKEISNKDNFDKAMEGI